MVTAKSWYFYKKAPSYIFDCVLNTPVDFLLQNYLTVCLIDIFLLFAKNRKKYLVIKLISLSWLLENTN